VIKFESSSGSERVAQARLHGRSDTQTQRNVR